MLDGSELSTALQSSSMTLSFDNRRDAVRFVKNVRKNLIPDLLWIITTSQERYGGYSATIVTDGSLEGIATLYSSGAWQTT